MKSSPQKVVKQSSAQSTCVVCGDAHEKLVPLNDLYNWRMMWNAAKVRCNERILALGSADEVPENLMYGSECRKTFVRKSTLKRLQRKVTRQEKEMSSKSQVSADKKADLPHTPKLSKQLSEGEQEKAQNENVSLLAKIKADFPHSRRLSKQHSEGEQEKAENENISRLGRNKVARHNVVKHSSRNKLVTSHNRLRQRGRGRPPKSRGRLVSQRRYMKWDTSVLNNFHTWNRVINAAYDVDILKFTCNEQVANETHCSCYRKYTQADNKSKGKSGPNGFEQRGDMDLDCSLDYDSVEAKAYSALFEHIREKSFSQSHSEVLTLSDLIDLLCSKMIANGVKGVRDSTKKSTRRKIEAEFGKSILFVKTESGIVYLMKSTVSQKDPDKELHDTQQEMKQIEKKSAHC